MKIDFEEKWKDVVGFEGFYKVSNKGRVKSIERTIQRKTTPLKVKEKMMSLSVDVNGYHILGLRKDKKKYTKRVHRLVAEAFIPNPDDNPQVNHINGNGKDNYVSNLEWCTSQENVDHAVLNGFHPRGDKIGTSKLTTNNILKIRSLLENTSLSQGEIADKFDVHQSLISRIKTGEVWSHTNKQSILKIKEEL